MRILKSLATLIVASVVGTIPACGTMGGGMKYLIDPLVVVTQT